jgi:Fur family ferric uptake transcriptional regulator
VDGILATLRAEGMRITASRRGIVRALFRAQRPLSLTEIQEWATREAGVAPDYATVFRMMTLLVRLRIVHKVNLKRSCSYYELTDPSKHYDHLVCTGCGKVVLLSIPCPVGETERMIERELGFSGLTHSLEFFGRCPDCIRGVTAAAIEEAVSP